MSRRPLLRVAAWIAAPLAIGLLAVVAFELVVRPAPPVLAQTATVFFGLSALTALAGVLLPRATARLDSLVRVVLVVAVAAMTATAVTVGVSAGFFMLSASQLSTLAVLLAFGIGLGLVLEGAVAQSLARDVRRLRATASRLAAGDRDARARLDRRDEVGQAARALDSMAEQLAVMEEERARSNRARQAFLAGVGHDLRTPLAALRAAVEALEDGLAPDPARYFAAMHHNLAALRSLVEDLFLLARIEAGFDFRRSAVDLAEVADEAVEALSPTARERRVTLRLRAEGPVVAVGGSPELSRAVRNLLDNAIRCAPAGSEVVVEVSSSSDGPLLRVLDEGDGFTADLRAVLAGEYARDAPVEGRTAGGTGLGLVIAKGLVEAHGGNIWAEPGPGGRIAFRLPAAQ